MDQDGQDGGENRTGAPAPLLVGV